MSYSLHGAGLLRPAGGAGDAAVRLEHDIQVHPRPDIAVIGDANGRTAGDIADRQGNILVWPGYLGQDLLADDRDGHGPGADALRTGGGDKSAHQLRIHLMHIGKSGQIGLLPAAAGACADYISLCSI